MSRFLDKLSDKFNDKLALDKLSGRIERLKESVQYAYNPNSRHDEEHEQAEDRKRTALCESHRFGSFADEQPGCHVKWFVNGHDYFWALSEILDRAQESIFIKGWWVTPELWLRRPPAENAEWRLDRLLKRKAEAGVKIFIIVYKEENVISGMSMSSAHTKHHLEDLHDNIRVVRHPDHLGGDVTLNWSHHSKIVVVDNIYACVGGLDLCFGRWDTSAHPLADVHPTDFFRTLFPGQDFNNARVADFQHVDKWVSNQQSRLDTARMPWCDVHSMMVGPAVLDVAQYFIESWNFIRTLKYKHKHGYPLIAFPHVGKNGEPPEPLHIIEHPHWELFKAGVDGLASFTRHALPPQDELGIEPLGGLGHKGNMRVQIVRSASDWSHGILTEHSIMNAYLQMISEASHHIYIENQFFVTTAGDKGPVKNQIGAAIANRVISAARDGKKFQVVIVIPAVPGFAGDLKGNSGTLAILGATYDSLYRGGNSIFEVIQRAGYDPNEYIQVYNLRSYDRLNSDPARLDAMAARSGVTFQQAQAALSRVYLGRDVIESELEKNMTVTYALGAEGGEVANLDAKSDKRKKEAANTVTIELPRDYDEAVDIIRRFEQAGTVDERFSDSIAHHAMHSQGSVAEEAWSGDEASERNAYVTEEAYIHSKLMIVDDRRVLIGSANINERSQLGDRDLEIAAIIEDLDMIDSTMNGAPYKAARFAATFRREIYRQHLGLSEPQMCPPHPHQPEPVTPAMQAVDVPQIDVTGSREDNIVEDPLGEELLNMLKATGDRNTELFESVFHCVPTNQVKTWKEYVEFVPQAPIKVGHVATLDMPVQFIREKLDQIRGRLVTMPQHFLEQENLMALDASVNPATLQIYI